MRFLSFFSSSSLKIGILSNERITSYILYCVLIGNLTISCTNPELADFLRAEPSRIKIFILLLIKHPI
jgi:hypothetical protein